MNTIQLVKNITYMVQNGDYVAGHAIFKGRKNSVTAPDKILKEGFMIQDAFRGLPFTSRRFESKFEDCLCNLTDLSENSSKAVVIISIPNELLSTYDKRYFSSCDSSSIVLELTGEESEDYKDIYGIPTKIAILPSIYVLGYLDVQKNIFIKNPNYAFDSYNKDSNISKLKLILDKRYEKISKESQHNLIKRM